MIPTYIFSLHFFYVLMRKAFQEGTSYTSRSWYRPLNFWQILPFFLNDWENVVTFGASKTKVFHLPGWHTFHISSFLFGSTAVYYLHVIDIHGLYFMKNINLICGILNSSRIHVRISYDVMKHLALFSHSFPSPWTKKIKLRKKSRSIAALLKGDCRKVPKWVRSI